MEGVRCCHPDCSLHDFLPFHCPKCERSYCLEHRSRFVHPCVSEDVDDVDSEQASASASSSGLLSQTYRSMMNRVQNRHEDLNTHYANNGKASRTHYRLQSQQQALQNIPIQTKNFQQYYNRLQTLTDNNDSNGQGSTTHGTATAGGGGNWTTERQRLQEKERLKKQRIAKQTKCMMIKQKANGNDHIPLQDRQYFIIHLDAIPTTTVDAQGRAHTTTTADDPHTRIFLYFDQSTLLRDCLHYLKTHYSRNIELDIETQRLQHQQHRVFNIADLSIVVKTIDSPEWRLWNRNAPIKDLFENFEDIWISYIPTPMVMEAQEAIDRLLVEQRRMLQQLESGSVSPSSSVPTGHAASGSPVPSAKQEAAVEKESYAKGEQAWYYKTPYVEDADPIVLKSVEEAHQHNIPLILVKIIGVHHDDFPNIYYTISMVQPPHGVGLDSQKLVFHTEKQTDKAHLVPYIPTTEPEIHMKDHNSHTHNRSNQQLLHLQAEIESLGHVISIRASHGKQELPDIRISLISTVAQLKTLLSHHTNIPANRMKLIYKGALLKPDSAVINGFRIPQNGKITIMG